jgi:hypothetical protein
MTARDTTKQRLIESGLFKEGAGCLYVEDGATSVSGHHIGARAVLRFNTTGDLVSVGVSATPSPGVREVLNICAGIEADEKRTAEATAAEQRRVKHAAGEAP